MSGFAVFLLFASLPFVFVTLFAVMRLIDSIVEHRRPPLAALILWGIGVLLLLVSIGLAILSGYFNLHLYLFGKGVYLWQSILLTLMAPCLLFGGLLLAVRKVLSFKTLILGVLLSGWLFMILLVGWFIHGDVVYTEISSPSSAGPVHELVVEEKSWFMIGEGVIYEKVSPCFMRQLDEYVLDDGWCPMHEGYCAFTWYEDGFIINCQPEEKIKYIS